MIYVWWDALGNYLTSLNVGAAPPRDIDYQRWWAGADRRIHVVGKGVLRFHAVYWPAILLSAGLPLPTEIFVHDYLTIDGHKISKSGPGGSAVDHDPAVLSETYGADALRWWLLREVPRSGDTDFTVGKLIARANDELAHGLGNLVNRVVSLVHSYRNGVAPTCGPPPGSGRFLAAAADGRERAHPAAASDAIAAPAPDWPADAAALRAALEAAPDAVRAALARYDFRTGAAAVWQIVGQANRYIEAAEPWHLARAERAGDRIAGDRLDQVLGALIAACQVVAAELWPFLPDLAARVAAACNDFGGKLPPPKPVFPRIDPPARPGAAGPADQPPSAPARRQYAAVAAAGAAEGGQRRHRDPVRPTVSEVA